MKKLCGLIISFLAVSAYGQDKIKTDRPGESQSPYVLSKKQFQSELGLQFENDDKLATIYHPSALWRYGLVKRFELQLTTEVVTKETPLMIPAGNDFISGLLPVKIGGKVGLWEETGALPKTSLLVHTSIPKLSSKKFRQEKWAPDLRLAMLHTLSKKIDLEYNAGVEWNGKDDSPKWVYTVSPSFELSDKCSAFIEVYGFLGKSHPEHTLDGGFLLLLSDRAQLDLAAGVGLSNAAPDGFVTIGFSFRVGR